MIMDFSSQPALAVPNEQRREKPELKERVPHG
jgi:hypothetical protein